MTDLTAAIHARYEAARLRSAGSTRSPTDSIATRG